MASQNNFLRALQKIANHNLLADRFSDFSDETMQSITFKSMHFLHRYYALYSVTEFESCPISQGLLKVATLGFALKSTFMDYVLEHLTITQQLGLFDVEVPACSDNGFAAYLHKG